MTSSNTDSRAGDGLAVGVFLALFAGVLLFVSSSTDLARFPDRAVGAALLAGVDVSRRYGLYLRIVAIPLGIVLATHYMTRRWRQLFPRWFEGIRARAEHEIIQTMCCVGAVALVASVAADHLENWPFAAAMLGGVALVGALGAVRRVWPRMTVVRHVTVWVTTAPLLILPWAMTFAAGVLVAAPKDHPPRAFVWTAVGLSLIFPVSLILLMRWPGRLPRARIRRAFALASLPLLTFPLFCPVANEIQHALVTRVSSARKVALVGFFVLAAISLVLLGLTLLGRIRVRQPRRLLSRWCFPALVFGAALVEAHLHKINGGFDVLHDGEPTTAVQQLLKYHRWPFVDIWPAHGLADYFGVLYAKVNGYVPVEIDSWSSVLVAFTSLGTYAVLAAVTSPLFALGLCTLTPIEALFPTPRHSYFHADPTLLGMALLIGWVCRQPTRRRLTVLAVASVLSFLWTPSSGVACVAGVLSLLGLGAVTAKNPQAARRGLVVFGAVSASFLAVYVVALLIHHRPLGDTFSMVLGFFRSEPLIGGRATVIKGFDTLAFFQYVMLPAVGVAFLFCVARRAIERRPLRNEQLVLAFVTVASFVIFARTLSRHGLIEHYQPFFFPFLACSALIWPLGRDSAAARAWFAGVLAIYLVAFPSPPPRSEAAPPYAFHNWLKGETRIAVPPRTYGSIKTFIDANSRPGDTFLEMLSAPLLYAFMEREVPDLFFLPTMFYATDSVQNAYLRRLEAWNKDDRVPIVILPGTTTVGDLDDIPTQVRSYRLAEYVYRHYLPVTTIEGFEIWMSRTRWLQKSATSQAVPLPFLEAERFQVNDVDARREAEALVLAAKSGDPRISDFVGVPPGGQGMSPGLRLRYRSNKAGNLRVYFRRGGDDDWNESDSATVALEAVNDWKESVVLVPFALAASERLQSIRFDLPADSEVAVKDLALVYNQPRSGNPERFGLGMLPFLWGTFDARAAARTTALQETIKLPDEPAKARYDLPVDPVVDKSTGNYLHLCISLPVEKKPEQKARPQELVDRPSGWSVAGKVKLRYGTNPPATFDFDLVRPSLKGSADQKPFTDACKDYLVRLSSQYAWMSQPVSTIKLESNVAFRLKTAEIRKGD